jgi:hypothetical protein
MKNDNSPLAFSNLVQAFRDRFSKLTDPRKRVTEDSYPLVDVAMAGLAMFHFQDPSFLQFQESLEKTQRRSNLQTLFGVTRVPKTSQMKTLLDGVNPDEIRGGFSDVISALDRAKLLGRYRFLHGRYLTSIDGSEYFSSSKCYCAGCLQRKKSDGSIQYHHQILQASIVNPQIKTVLPIEAEEVRRQDGTSKQDCELNAAKRLIPKLVAEHPHMDLVILGDGLYSHVSFVQLLREHRLSFILVAKPSDHKAMWEDLRGLREAGGIGRLEKIDKRGRRHVYEFCNDVILRSDAKERVNWFSYQLINENGVIGYENSWVTDQVVTARNVEELVAAGRCRWKIENEGFNTLKNHGYNLDHNFGHGEKHLSYVLFLLNLLAFAMHQVMTLRDKAFQKVAAQFTSRKELWNHLRAVVRLFVVESWQALMAMFLGDRLRQKLQGT